MGDIIRKIADEVWRVKMTEFVRKQPEKAEELSKMLNDGARFQLSSFKAEDRAKLNATLAAYVAVTPKDVEESLDFHLSNVAIQAEIATAVETYERSKKFLSGIKKSRRD